MKEPCVGIKYSRTLLPRAVVPRKHSDAMPRASRPATCDTTRRKSEGRKWPKGRVFHVLDLYTLSTQVIDMTPDLPSDKEIVAFIRKHIKQNARDNDGNVT